MKSLIVILLGLATSFYFTDLKAESGFESLFCPIMVFFFLIALAFKIVTKMHRSKGGMGLDFWDGDGGGDCGGGGD